MKPRLVEITGDSLQPVLHRGDFVIASPATGWAGEGYYVLTNPYGDEVVFYCTACGTAAGPRVRLGSHLEVAGRKVYFDQDITRAEFERAVTGKVAVTCQVRDRSLFPALPTAA